MNRTTKLLRKNSTPYKILKTLAAGSGILFISSFNPMGGAQIVRALVKNYFRKKQFERYRFLRDLKNLQERKLLNYQEITGGGVELKITRRGKETMLKYQLDEIQLQKQLVWDKKWRLVMFDVPHEKRRARDALREKLRDLKFCQLQKSVFITPYPCEDEIDFIGTIFEVRPHILILYISKFEGEEKLRHHFKL